MGISVDSLNYLKFLIIMTISFLFWSPGTVLNDHFLDRNSRNSHNNPYPTEIPVIPIIIHNRLGKPHPKYYDNFTRAKHDGN